MNFFSGYEKAFDFVSLKILKKIKISDIITKFLLNFYNKRKIKIITEYDLTKEFEAEDELDQREVISPLM